MSQSANRASLVIALLLGLGALVGAGISCSKTLSFKSSATSVEGVVVKLEPRNSRRGGAAFAPVFEFKDAGGRSHRVTSSTSSSPAAYDVGGKLAVLYLPNDPDQARIDSFSSLWAVPAIFGSLGLAFTLGAIIPLVKRRGP